METTARKTALAFQANFDPYIDTYQELTAFIASRTKSIQCKAHALADDFYALGSELSRFSSLLRSTEVP